MKHVDDYADRVPKDWIERGGLFLPMYQSEAMWINFVSCAVGGQVCYPMAVKVGTGKINAVTGEAWRAGLHRDPQDYMVGCEQPWLDGYCIEKGIIRQFVAQPFGSGYSAEAQISGTDIHGGIQITVYPMKREVFEKRFPVGSSERLLHRCKNRTITVEDVYYHKGPGADRSSSRVMSLAPGGRMKQTIYDDPFDINDWDIVQGRRCFVHIANSKVWQDITGERPPTTPPTASDYTNAGLPWYNVYDGDKEALEGSAILNGLKSVAQMGEEKGEQPLPENEPVNPKALISYVSDGSSPKTIL